MEEQTESQEQMKEQSKEAVRLERIIGIVLLLPPIFGVVLFFLNLLIYRVGSIPEMGNLSDNWTGNYSDGGGYMSAAPIYLGLMAIAGALLLKGTDKKD
jgi:hypothetical protein